MSSEVSLRQEGSPMCPETPVKSREAESSVLIRVWIRDLEPVSGEAALDGRRAAPFEGWLDLLQRLSELVNSATEGSRR